MTRSERLVVIVGLVASAASSFAQVGRADWAVNAKESVADRPITKADVADVVRHASGDDAVNEDSIGDFAWVDEGGGRYLLLASTAVSRAFFNSLQVVEQRGGQPHLVQTIDVWVLASFRDRLKDLDGDGHPELILPVKLDPGDYRGSRPTAIWPAVYRWSGRRFIDASGAFSDYYRHGVLPELDAKIERAQGAEASATGSSKDDAAEDLAATWMVRDKIQRVTGEQPEAGLERAREWMTSASSALRQNAAAVFADMGRRSELQALAADKDGDVAEAAKRGLGRSRKPG